MMRTTSLPDLKEYGWVYDLAYDSWVNRGQRNAAMSEVPLMYDIRTDEMRPVTQADADRWANNQQAIGCYLRGQDILRAAMRAICNQKMDWRVMNAALIEFEKAMGPSEPKAQKRDT
jgi:hypothetical protein